jgi:ATP-dependent RNA helicase HelY
MDSAAEPSSPAEAYARFRGDQATPSLTAFARHYGFAFDDYQRKACAYVEAGSGVLVAAPTGAGKTIVGEFAVYLALQQGRKCFYTTPIKALSNQKYADLVARHGADSVGLLTGDSSINSEAPVVVMTTEVLRNMMYAGSSTLLGLGFVVMDEVHYLADRFRGAVWEEVIIGLAESVQVIALSATVSNAEEFGDWLAEVRGAMEIVVSERRPVPLFQHVLVGSELYDLYAGVAPTAAVDGSPAPKADVNPALLRIARDESRWVRDDSRRPRGRSGKGQRRVSYGSGSFGGASKNLGAPGRSENGRSNGGRSGGDRAGGGAGSDWGRSDRVRSDGGYRPRSMAGPSRADMVKTLDDAALLPAIVFIFSRVGCDAAVSQLLGSGIVLTSKNERSEIGEILRRHTVSLGEADLRVLRYDSFAEALSRGIAAHHAGMLPAFKECVEEAFVRGLVKVVFATETLALGINMPARSVVLEKLVKYNGETHADVTPGEYTQLTGRAGRRGIDVEGHAVVLWRAGLDPRALAGLAARRTYPLKSSFAPTYNMAVNLVGSVGRDRARTLLEQSFAQFQSDRSVVGLARGVARNEQAIAEYLAAAACELGDFAEYARLRARISDLEADQSRSRQADRRAEASGSLEGLKPGDVIKVPTGKSHGWAVVIDPGTRDQTGPRGRHQPDGPRPQVMTEERHIRRLSLLDFPTPAVVVGKIKIPRHFDARDASSRRSLAAAFHSRLKTLDSEALRHRPPPADSETSEEIADLRAEVRAHPCHRCPDREAHARWAERALRLERENGQVEQRMASRTNTIAAHFDKICLVLESLGYLEDGVRVTEQGRRLARIYTELDLVAAECLRAGLFDDLTHPQLAAVLASFVYEARRSDGFEHRPRMPDAMTAHVMSEVRKVWREVSLLERDHRLERGPEPDIGFSEAAYGWAAGRPLAEVLADSGLTAGDFVRWVRQVLDFADQIGQAAGRGPLRQTAHELTRSMRRGVVDFTPDDSDEPEA